MLFVYAETVNIKKFGRIPTFPTFLREEGCRGVNNASYSGFQNPKCSETGDTRSFVAIILVFHTNM
jgi:hypothetical protein